MEGEVVTMDEHSPAELDSLARGLATGSLSRRGALKAGVAGVLGATAVSLGIAKPAPARKRAGACKQCGGETSCKPSMCGTPRGGEDWCVCVESVTGRQCCVGAKCGAKRCSKNSQCANDEICTKEFKKFCCASPKDDADGKSKKKGVCLKRCNSDH
jgi:hypothetical protein